MARNTTFIAGIVTLLALLAWIGVGVLISLIHTAQSDYVAQAQHRAQLSGQDSQASYLHALVSESADARGQLDALFNVNPSALADAINAAGTSAGVHIQITNALSDNPLLLASGSGAQAFSFIATSQGSFQNVMYAAGLLETLPVPSSIQQMQFTHTPSTPGSPGNNASWQVSAQVKIFTNSSISS